ncbi:zinc-binding dehydrogenase [Streptomyces sp. NPDC050529]|uniref:zinc-binding dehydrogenase n=1 Tax=unclassified Streptomyces TaxID=2593676 RepID=UPI002DD9000D|nr:zinc-binding dehydrogenase [Streptomyces sp. NBC_01022]WRZ79269.1 zinc-binding dehydrogenase [Streptomyces sp. NBC_01022]WRZ86407.1 zinc-binding dehydrogenase [Streptomyces sp. NBC_01022]
MTDPNSPSSARSAAPLPLAAVWSGHDSGFALTPRPRPELAPGEVLVRIELATICGSDLHTLSGDRPTPLPTVLGHEAVGIVEEVAGSVRTVDGRLVEPGGRVTWTIGTSCGSCRRCLRGVPQKCTAVRKYGHEAITGHWGLNGCFATHCHLVGGTGLVTVPEALPAAVAAPANCATATVVCAARRAELSAGDSVIVTGCGMLGLTAIAYARELGAEHVVACDIDGKRREMALEFGATAVCDPSELAEHALQYGADVVIELSGNSRAVQSALDIVGMDGRVALVGSVSPGPEVRFEPNTFVRNLSHIVGSHNYTVDDLAEAIRFLAGTPAQDLFAGLVSDPLPLTDIDAAVTAAREGIAPRIALHMN